VTFLLILGAYLALSLGTTALWSRLFRRAGSLADVVQVQIRGEEIAELDRWLALPPYVGDRP